MLPAPGFPACAAMIQNTVVDIASALIRDWRMYRARAWMMAWLQALDNAVVRAVDTDADLGHGLGGASVEAGDGVNPARARRSRRTHAAKSATGDLTTSPRWFARRRSALRIRASS